MRGVSSGEAFLNSWHALLQYQQSPSRCSSSAAGDGMSAVVPPTLLPAQVSPMFSCRGLLDAAGLSPGTAPAGAVPHHSKQTALCWGGELSWLWEHGWEERPPFCGSAELWELPSL